MPDKTGSRSIPPSLVAAAVLLAALILAHYLIGGGWREAWHGIGSSSMSPAFADLRTITHSLDAVRAGADPYVDTQFDPWHRTYNYPRAWLWFASLGLGSQSTMAIGVIMAVLLFLSLTLLFRPRNPVSWLAAFGLSLSPPVQLAIERGNSDILIFSLLVLGLLASGRLSARAQTLARIGLIAVLTTLKIYPVAAVVVLVRNRSGLVLAAFAGIVALACLWLSLHPGDFAHVLGNTPQSIVNSFGALPLVQTLADAMGHPDGIRPVAIGLAVLVGGVSAVAAVIRPGFVDRLLPSLEAGRAVDDVALACLGNYLLAFLLGSSWDYRLVFLIGMVPAMLAAYDRDPRRGALVMPVLIGAFVWAGPLSPYIHAGEEVLDWAIFAVSSGWLAATLAARLGIGRAARPAGAARVARSLAA